MLSENALRYVKQNTNFHNFKNRSFLKDIVLLQSEFGPNRCSSQNNKMQNKKQTRKIQNNMRFKKGRFEEGIWIQETPKIVKI